MTQPLSWNLHGNDQLSAVLEKLDRTLTGIGKKLDGVSGDAKRMGDSLETAERKAEGFTSKVAGVAGTVGKFGAAMAAAAAAAVSAIGAVGVAFAREKSKADALLAGQLGASSQQAKELGKATGELYGKGFAESAELAADAVRATIQNSLVGKDASATIIAEMSARTSTLAGLLESDASRVSSAISQMLRTGLVRNAEEAFDLLVAATQKGLNKQDDLLDTINEYSTFFRNLGIDGPYAMGLISQAVQAGARDTDKAADAIKEFSLRAVDGSALTRRGFQLLGLDADKMAKRIAQGGDGAAEAFDTVLIKLRELKDPVAKAQAAVALFGAPGEDLGAALFAMDPAKAFKEFGRAVSDTQGSMDRAMKAQVTGWSRIDSIFSTLKTKLADVLTPAIDKALDNLGGMGRDVKKIFDGSAVPKEMMDALRELGDKIGPKVKESWDKILKTISDNKDGLEKFGRFLAEYVIPFLGSTFVVAIDTVTLAFQGIITAIAHVVDAIQFMVLNALNFLGFFVHATEKAFGWIPGLGDKIKENARKFDEWAKGILNDLAKLDGKSVNISVRVKYKGDRAAYWMEQIDKEFSTRAAGGPIWPGQVYTWNEQGQEHLYSTTSGMAVMSAAETHAMASRSGGGDEIVGTLRVVHETPDGQVIRDELLSLKRRRGFATLGLA